MSTELTSHSSLNLVLICKRLQAYYLGKPDSKSEATSFSIVRGVPFSNKRVKSLLGTDTLLLVVVLERGVEVT